MIVMGPCAVGASVWWGLSPNRLGAPFDGGDGRVAALVGCAWSLLADCPLIRAEKKSATLLREQESISSEASKFLLVVEFV